MTRYVVTDSLSHMKLTKRRLFKIALLTTVLTSIEIVPAKLPDFYHYGFSWHTFGILYVGNLVLALTILNWAADAW